MQTILSHYLHCYCIAVDNNIVTLSTLLLNDTIAVDNNIVALSTLLLNGAMQLLTILSHYLKCYYMTFYQ